MELLFAIILIMLMMGISIRRCIKEFYQYNYGRCSCGGRFRQVFLLSAPLDYLYRCDKCGKEGTLLVFIKPEDREK